MISIYNMVVRILISLTAVKIRVGLDVVRSQRMANWRSQLQMESSRPPVTSGLAAGGIYIDGWWHLHGVKDVQHCSRCVFGSQYLQVIK